MVSDGFDKLDPVVLQGDEAVYLVNIGHLWLVLGSAEAEAVIDVFVSVEGIDSFI